MRGRLVAQQRSVFQCLVHIDGGGLASLRLQRRGLGLEQNMLLTALRDCGWRGGSGLQCRRGIVAEMEVGALGAVGGHACGGTAAGRAGSSCARIECPSSASGEFEQLSTKFDALVFARLNQVARLPPAGRWVSEQGVVAVAMCNAAPSRAQRVLAVAVNRWSARRRGDGPRARRRRADCSAAHAYGKEGEAFEEAGRNQAWAGAGIAPRLSQHVGPCAGHEPESKHR